MRRRVTELVIVFRQRNRFDLRKGIVDRGGME
jgi:hypothetical protein